jgi:hypothetical protein
MAHHIARQSENYDQPATYQITVKGRIDLSWSERLEGMQITRDASQEAVPVTTLLGELSDQAALAGVLNTLYELHLAVISVQRLEINGNIQSES